VFRDGKDWILQDLLEAENRLTVAIGDYFQLAISQSFVEGISEIRSGVIEIRRVLYDHSQQCSPQDPTKTIQATMESLFSRLHADSFDQDPLKFGNAFLNELKLDTSSFQCKFDRKSFIARGGFAEVFHGTYNSQPVAVKRLRSDAMLPALGMNLLKHEAVILASCAIHPNIIRIVGFKGIQSERPLIVMECLSCTLYDAIHDTEVAVPTIEFPYSKRWRLMGQIIGALEFIHLRNISHGDLKSTNVLLNEDYTVAKLADFGATRVKGLNTTDACIDAQDRIGKRRRAPGTCAYLAPEILTSDIPEGVPSRSAEIFSMGVTLWECLKGEIPHEGMREANVAIKAERDPENMLDLGKIPPEGGRSSQVAKRNLYIVVEACLASDRRARPTASELVQAWHLETMPRDYFSADASRNDVRFHTPTYLSPLSQFKPSCSIRSYSSSCSCCSLTESVRPPKPLRV